MQIPQTRLVFQSIRILENTFPTIARVWAVYGFDVFTYGQLVKLSYFGYKREWLWLWILPPTQY